MASMQGGGAPGGMAVLEQALRDAVDTLSASPPSSRTRELLFEAKRLRSAMTRWQAVRPTPEAKQEMLARVMELASAIRAENPASRAPERTDAADDARAPSAAPLGRVITKRLE